jgi:hypothetical protein
LFPLLSIRFEILTAKASSRHSRNTVAEAAERKMNIEEEEEEQQQQQQQQRSRNANGWQQQEILEVPA